MMTSAAEESTAPPRQEITRPVVFQCAHCRTIVADSTDLVDRRADLRWVVFSRRHGNVAVRSESWLFSDDAATYGCLYNPLHCGKCDAVVGTTFHTTNAAIEGVRGKFVLFTSALLVYFPSLSASHCRCRYELNFDEHEMERQLREQLGHLLPAPVGGDAGKEDADETTVRRLQQEIGKLQKFCLALHQRCAMLESTVRALQPSTATFLAENQASPTPSLAPPTSPSTSATATSNGGIKRGRGRPRKHMPVFL